MELKAFRSIAPAPGARRGPCPRGPGSRWSRVSAMASSPLRSRCRWVSGTSMANVVRVARRAWSVSVRRLEVDRDLGPGLGPAGVGDRLPLGLGAVRSAAGRCCRRSPRRCRRTLPPCRGDHARGSPPAATAQTACSRLDPQPKFGPTTRTVAPFGRGLVQRELGILGRRACRGRRPRARSRRRSACRRRAGGRSRSARPA